MNRYGKRYHLHQEFLRGGEILTTFLTKRDGNTSEVRKINCWTARNSRYNAKHEQVCVGGKARMSSMITQSSRGKDGISHHEFNWYPGRVQNADDDHDTFVERFHEDVIDRRQHQVKGMMNQKVTGTNGTSQTRNQACCSRRNDMTRKIDLNLAHHRKLCSRIKDRVV